MEENPKFIVNLELQDDDVQEIKKMITDHLKSRVTSKILQFYQKNENFKDKESFSGLLLGEKYKIREPLPDGLCELFALLKSGKELPTGAKLVVPFRLI
jgi:hypothetical protein